MLTYIAWSRTGGALPKSLHPWPYLFSLPTLFLHLSTVTSQRRFEFQTGAKGLGMLLLPKFGKISV